MLHATPFRFAFTLLELILVLAILALGAAMVMPQLSRFSQGRLTLDSAGQFLALSQYARQLAIQQATVTRLHLDTATGRYWLTIQRRGVFQAPATDFGQKFALPTGMPAVWESPQEVIDQGYIQFEPDGSQDVASLLWTSSRGDRVRIMNQTPSESLRLVSDGLESEVLR